MTPTEATVVCRAMRPDEMQEVSRVILGSFEEFIAPESTEHGREEFRRYVEPTALAQRIRADHFILVADVDGRIGGMIEVRQNNHIALLFVDKRVQHRGVARELMHQALETARSRRPGLERVTVNSSRFAVPMYEKLGFLQTGPEREVNGIVFIPMARRIV